MEYCIIYSCFILFSIDFKIYFTIILSFFVEHTLYGLRY